MFLVCGDPVDRYAGCVRYLESQILLLHLLYNIFLTSELTYVILVKKWCGVDFQRVSYFQSWALAQSL